MSKYDNVKIEDDNPHSAIAIPTLLEPKFITSGDFLSIQHKDTNLMQLVERINAVAGYVKDRVGDIYNLQALTIDELFGLESGMKQYFKANSSSRISYMIDFINQDFSGEQWDRLTNSEKETIKYTKERDRSSSDLNRMTQDREGRLAVIILKMYDRMVNNNYQFRVNEMSIDYLWDKLGYTPGIRHIAVFYIEKFLAEKVRAKRDPVYNNAVYQNLENVLKFHEQIKGTLDPSESVRSSINYLVRKMMDLKSRTTLSPQQRGFALSLMINYITLIQNYLIFEKGANLNAATAQLKF